MSALFTAETLARLEEAARALLSPLAAPDADAWRLAAARAVRTLLGADHAVFGVAGLERPYVCDGLDDATWAAYAAYVTPAPGSWGAADPVVDRWLQAHQTTGGGAFDEAVMEAALRPHGLALRDSALLNAVAWPRRMFGMRGITAAAGGLGGGLQVTFERPPDDAGGGEGLVLLGALLPSFRAGLDALAGLDAYRGALAAVLDALPQSVAAFSADGRPLHRNTALVRLLADEPGAALVEGALAHFALRFRRFGFTRRTEWGGPAPFGTTVSTTRGSYGLHGTLVGEGELGPAGGFLVTVAPPPGPPASGAPAAGRSTLSAP